MLENGPASARYQALIQLLRTAEDLWNASRVFFARWDLSPSQFNVLNLLYGKVNGLSQSELSRLLIMHRSNATGLVDRLERRRLVQRTEDPQDRRAYRVLLTSVGVDLLHEIYPHYFAAADEVWTGMPPDRVEGLLQELRDLATQATQVAGKHSPQIAHSVQSPEPSIPQAPSARRQSRRTPKPKPESESSGGVPQTSVSASPPQLSADLAEESSAGLRTADL